VTVWHEEITSDMLQSENTEVVEIAAANPEAAITRFREVTDSRST
jgi:hypothetical protein